jgi:hypothetical protein
VPARFGQPGKIIEIVFLTESIDGVSSLQWRKQQDNAASLFGQCFPPRVIIRARLTFQGIRTQRNANQQLAEKKKRKDLAHRGSISAS